MHIHFVNHDDPVGLFSRLCAVMRVKFVAAVRNVTHHREHVANAITQLADFELALYIMVKHEFIVFSAVFQRVPARMRTQQRVNGLLNGANGCRQTRSNIGGQRLALLYALDLGIAKRAKGPRKPDRKMLVAGSRVQAIPIGKRA